MKLNFYVIQDNGGFYWFVNLYGEMSNARGPFENADDAKADAEKFFTEILGRNVVVDNWSRAQ